MSEKTKIIYDCDPGVDDTMALMIACNNPKIDLLGVCTISGNQTIEVTTQNAINVTQWLGVDVPVYSGCAGPLVRDAVEVPKEFHGEDGIKGATFPVYSKRAEEKHAVQFIIDTLTHSDGDITVVTTGPMTNLAMAMRLEPEIISKINRILLMGGSVGKGNITPSAEFNIYADADAAHICFKSGCDITMVGLDATEKATCFDEDIERMRKINNKASKLFCDIAKSYIDSQMKLHNQIGGPLHDPLALASLIDPNVIKTIPAYTTVEVRAVESYGRTNCNSYFYKGIKANSQVAIDTNRELFFDILEESLRHFS